MRFECLKEVVIVHRSYLKDQYDIMFLTFLCSRGSVTALAEVRTSGCYCALDYSPQGKIGFTG